MPDPSPHPEFGPSDEEIEYRMMMEARYDARPQDMIELADDPFEGLELDRSYATQETTR